MARVVGIGGVFLRARDPAALQRWYHEVLGIVPEGDAPYSTLTASAGDQTVWAVFPADTDYFGKGDQAVMVNYRVDDLDAVLERLRAAGAQVDDDIQEEYGRFGWARDPEGNRFELWEPPPGDATSP